MHCSNKIAKSKKAPKPPKAIAKSNLLVPYEDIELNQGSDLGNDDDDEVDDIDSNLVDPQLCGAFACDIYEHLRSSEVGIAEFNTKTCSVSELDSIVVCNAGEEKTCF